MILAGCAMRMKRLLAFGGIEICNHIPELIKMFLKMRRASLDMRLKFQDPEKKGSKTCL